MVDEHGATYFGIFEIDETGDRAKLKIEYRKGDYPSGFGTGASTYIVRSNLGRRGDGSELGVLAQP